MFRLQKKQTLARAPKWKPVGWHMGARWMAHGNPLDGIWEPVGRLLQATMDNRKNFL